MSPDISPLDGETYEGVGSTDRGAVREGGVVSERYVDAREHAEIMGVSVSTVKRLVANGMPSETWGMALTRRYLPSQALAWAQNRPNMRVDNPPAGRVNVTTGPTNQEAT